MENRWLRLILGWKDHGETQDNAHETSPGGGGRGGRSGEAFLCTGMPGWLRWPWPVPLLLARHKQVTTPTYSYNPAGAKKEKGCCAVVCHGSSLDQEIRDGFLGA